MRPTGPLRNLMIVVLSVACGIAAAACAPPSMPPPPTPVADAGSGPTTCGSLRNCITACDRDISCQFACYNGVPVAERDQHAQLVSCASAPCRDGYDYACRCANECGRGGSCAALVAACRDPGVPDILCDQMCAGL